MDSLSFIFGLYMFLMRFQGYNKTNISANKLFSVSLRRFYASHINSMLPHKTTFPTWERAANIFPPENLSLDLGYTPKRLGVTKEMGIPKRVWGVPGQGTAAAAVGHTQLAQPPSPSNARRDKISREGIPSLRLDLRF